METDQLLTANRLPGAAPRHFLGHWFRVPERITYKLCVLVFNCLHGTAPRYLQEVIQPVAEVTSRRRLRSASSSALVVPATRRSYIAWRPSPCGCWTTRMEQSTR